MNLTIRVAQIQTTPEAPAIARRKPMKSEYLWMLAAAATMVVVAPVAAYLRVT
jgi:hypothetical protein